MGSAAVAGAGAVEHGEGALVVVQVTGEVKVDTVLLQITGADRDAQQAFTGVRSSWSTVSEVACGGVERCKTKNCSAAGWLASQ
jgi:hypothetical protein